MKTFLLFVALICATTMATPLPPTTASGEPLSAFLGSLKQGLENLLAMVNRFENGQSTQIDQSMTRILVVTGVNSASGPTSTYTTKTELWPKPDSQCSLHDFPLEVGGAVGFWTAQGPTVCGGSKIGRLTENRCFLYTKNQWMPWTNMGTARWGASALQINPNQALIIGGYDENLEDLKTTELISSSGSEEQNNFPVKISYHCSFPFNATHAIVTGGNQDGSRSANTWFVDLTTTRVTPGPTMKTERVSHGCAIFQHRTKSYGVVSGGWNGGKLDSSEIIELDQESTEWTEGPKLPRKLETLTLVETSQGTYAMGGWAGWKNLRNEVFQLDCPGDQISSCQWKPVGNLEFARYDHVSIPIPESYDICN